MRSTDNRTVQSSMTRLYLSRVFSLENERIQGYNTVHNVFVLIVQELKILRHGVRSPQYMLRNTGKSAKLSCLSVYDAFSRLGDCLKKVCGTREESLSFETQTMI